MAERIKMPFGMWTWVGPKKHVLDGGTHWGRHLANTIEPSRRRCSLFIKLLSPTVNQPATEVL